MTRQAHERWNDDVERPDLETVSIEVPVFRVDRQLWRQARELGLDQAIRDDYADAIIVSFGGLLNALATLERGGLAVTFTDSELGGDDLPVVRPGGLEQT